MTPPTMLQRLPCFIGCWTLDFTPSDTAIDPKGFGGVMTPPYDPIVSICSLNCNLKSPHIDTLCGA